MGIDANLAPAAKRATLTAMALKDHLDPRRARGNDLRLKGGQTVNPDGSLTTRESSDFLEGDPTAPTQTRITRSTSVPKRPCTMCRHFSYDKGQQFFDHEGVGQVPKSEGGIIKPGSDGRAKGELATGDGGIYDSDEYGFCRRWTFRFGRRAQLTHRFGTCEEWEAVGRFASQR